MRVPGNTDTDPEIQVQEKHALYLIKGCGLRGCSCEVVWCMHLEGESWSGKHCEKPVESPRGMLEQLQYSAQVGGNSRRAWHGARVQRTSSSLSSSKLPKRERRR